MSSHFGTSHPWGLSKGIFFSELQILKKLPISWFIILYLLIGLHLRLSRFQSLEIGALRCESSIFGASETTKNDCFIFVLGYWRDLDLEPVIFRSLLKILTALAIIVLLGISFLRNLAFSRIFFIRFQFIFSLAFLLQGSMYVECGVDLRHR